MRTSSQQTNVKRAIDDVKSIFCKINEDFCQFKFIFVHKVCVFSFFFTYFTYFEQCSNLVIAQALEVLLWPKYHKVYGSVHSNNVVIAR